jgi:guanylate kinase
MVHMSGCLFYMTGKSATGKDHIFRALLNMPELALSPLVIATTRPMRKGEQNGREYFFTDVNELARLRRAGRIIEERRYDTVNGPWYYFTADDGSMDLAHRCYLGIGTLESLMKLRRYFGEGAVFPIYIDTEDGIRLDRALRREKKQREPNYAEVCRRFLADTEDFSPEHLQKAGISHVFANNGDLSVCIDQIARYIQSTKRSLSAG